MSANNSVAALWPLYEPSSSRADEDDRALPAMAARVILSGLREQPLHILAQMGIVERSDELRFASDFAAVLSIANGDQQ